MASQLTSWEPFGAPWKELPAEDIDLSGLADEVSDGTRARLARVVAHLGGRRAGCSFAELRTLSALPTDDLRYVLDLAIRARLVCRTGAGNSLRYLRKRER